MLLTVHGTDVVALRLGSSNISHIYNAGHRIDLGFGIELFDASTWSWSHGWTWAPPSFLFAYQGSRANVVAGVSSKMGQKYRLRFDYAVKSNVYVRFGRLQQAALFGNGHYDQIVEAERSSNMVFHANSAEADGARISNISLRVLP